MFNDVEVYQGFTANDITAAATQMVLHQLFLKFILQDSSEPLPNGLFWKLLSEITNNNIQNLYSALYNHLNCVDVFVVGIFRVKTYAWKIWNVSWHEIY